MSERRAAECFPVSDFINEELKSRGWDVARFAREAGINHLFASALVKGSSAVPITKPVAEALARAFGTSHELWLNLDGSYAKHVGRFP